MKPRRVTSSDESGKRQAIIDACRRINALGIVRRKMAGYGHADV